MPDYHAWTHRPKALGGTDPIPSLAMWPIKVFRDDIPVTTGDRKFDWMIPEDLDGNTLMKVAAFVSTAGSGTTTINIRKAQADGTNIGDVLTSPIHIDSGERNSIDATAQPAVSTASIATVAHGEHFEIDVDAVGSGATGLGVYFYFLAGPDAVLAVAGPPGEYAPGGTDVAIADGGTGASLADPGADSIMFWDDSGGGVDWLTIGSGLLITGTTLAATAAAPTAEDVTFDPTGTDLFATDVQAALEELAGGGGGGGGWDTQIVKSGDESVSGSTTLQNDDHLSFATTTGDAYEIEIVLVYGSPAGGATPDIKVAAGEDGTVRGAFNIVGGINTTDSGLQTGGFRTNQTENVGVGGAATDRVVVFRGNHVGAGGTFRVLWAQATSNANATIVRAGSRLRVTLLN